MTMKPLLIIRTGATFPDMAAQYGDFDNWITDRLDPTATPVMTVSPFAGDALPAAVDCCGVIITGSHDMVTDRHPWSEQSALWIKAVVAAEIPLLGICYGHQLLAYAMGGRVGDNPNGKEFGTIPIRLNAAGKRDPLFCGLPTTFAAHACHTQSVLELPAGATLLAESDMDPHHAFAVGERAWGVQFHPEFDVMMLRLYIERFAEVLSSQGQNVPALMAGLRETPHSEALLRLFQRLCR